MRIIVTGSCGDIGRAIVEKFLVSGHEVFGIDIQKQNFENNCYHHFVSDVREQLPDISGAEIVICAHGIQLPDEECIDVNLRGVINVVEKYGFGKEIKAVLNVASASARNGSEFPQYVASKAGVVGYTKNVALRLAKHGAVANTLSPGGVLTGSNAAVLDDPALKKEAIGESLLQKWATPEEIAEWAYFLTVNNRSMTGEDILVDNGEQLKSNFVWPKQRLF